MNKYNSDTDYTIILTTTVAESLTTTTAESSTTMISESPTTNIREIKGYQTEGRRYIASLNKVPLSAVLEGF